MMKKNKMAIKSRFAEISSFVSNSRQQYFRGKFYHRQLGNTDRAGIFTALSETERYSQYKLGAQSLMRQNDPHSEFFQDTVQGMRRRMEKTLAHRQLDAMYANYRMAIIGAAKLVFDTQLMQKKFAKRKYARFYGAFVKPISGRGFVPFDLPEIMDFSRGNSGAPASALNKFARPSYACIFPKLFANSIRRRQFIFITGLHQTICKSLGEGLKILAGEGEKGGEFSEYRGARKFEDFIALRALWFLKVYFDANLDAAGLGQKVKSAAAKGAPGERGALPPSWR